MLFGIDRWGIGGLYFLIGRVVFEFNFLFIFEVFLFMILNLIF